MKEISYINIKNITKDQFEKDEIVWHKNFKTKVTFLQELKPLKGRWFYVRLSNGGFMETQLIEKYTNQDKK